MRYSASAESKLAPWEFGISEISHVLLSLVQYTALVALSIGHSLFAKL